MAVIAPDLDASVAAATPARPTLAQALASIKAPQGWKRRLEDPANTFIRYPIALAVTRLLVRTSITPNQISLSQPLLAALAGWQLTYGSYQHDLVAVLAFEIRSILDCCDGSLARAKKMSSPSGHAIDGLADWLGVLFLYVGIFIRFNMHAPSSSLSFGNGSPLALLGVNGVLCLAIMSGAWRSFTSDYFRVKFVSVFESGKDATTDTLRSKILALGPHSSFFDKAEVFIGRMGHLAFNYEYLTRDKAESLRSGELCEALRREERAPATRVLAFLWALSNGDAFLTYVMIALLFGKLWLLQELYATVGIVTIVALFVASSAFVKSVVRRHASVAVA